MKFHSDKNHKISACTNPFFCLSILHPLFHIFFLSRFCLSSIKKKKKKMLDMCNTLSSSPSPNKNKTNYPYFYSTPQSRLPLSASGSTLTHLFPQEALFNRCYQSNPLPNEKKKRRSSEKVLWAVWRIFFCIRLATM